MLNELKEHPAVAVLIGLVVFVVVYLFARGGSGGTTVVQSGSSGPSDAVLQSSIAASAQTQALQASLTAHANDTQAQYNLGVLSLQTKQLQDAAGQNVALAQIAGNVNVSDTQAKTQADIAATVAGAQTTIATAQANGQVRIAESANQTAALLNSQNNETQRASITAQAAMFQEQLLTESKIAGINAGVQTTQITTAADVAKTQINAGRDVSLASINSTDLLNKLKADVATTQINRGADVASQQISAYETLGSQQLTAETGLASQELSAQQGRFQNVINLISGGFLNKGGEGGANQVAALQTAYGVAAPNPYQNAPGSSTLSNILSSISKAATAIGAGIFG